MEKNKNKTKSEIAYKLPLWLDDYCTYAWTSNNTMALMFWCDNDESKKIVKAINGEIKLNYENLRLSNKIELYDGKRHLLTVRGWGNLTGIGALNLPTKDAEKVQDNFVKAIIKALKNI